MKISELIKLLQNNLNKYGDLKIRIWPYDGQQNPSDAERIYVGINKSEQIFQPKLGKWIERNVEDYLLID